jgi:ubiquinone/menaquinone biosynthesis C-methylase UbiE
VRLEATVASGWGARASWWRNLQTTPAVEVWLAGIRCEPEQRFLDLAERIEVVDGYQRRHPRAVGLIGRLLVLGRDVSLDAAAQRLSMVAFRLPRADRFLTYAHASRVYDRIGRSQDLQVIYEHEAVRSLLAHGDFGGAHRVLELGYGTGALAQRLLAEHLPAESRYVGVDISPRMHELASRRLAHFGDRAELRLGDGSLRGAFAASSFDRVVATYVLDLLPPEEIDVCLSEAHRLLTPGGLLCLTSLTYGRTAPTRLLTRAWLTLWALRPGLVGGCRPLRLAEHLAPNLWELRHHDVITTLAISSEVVVAAPRATSPPPSPPNPSSR